VRVIAEFVGGGFGRMIAAGPEGRSRQSCRGALAFRAPGLVEGTTAYEQAIDELAKALGRDPLDLRPPAPLRPRSTLLQDALDQVAAGVQNLVFVCGRIRSRDRALDRAYTELTDTLGDATVDGGGQRTPLSSQRRTDLGCQIAQVAVDPGIGAVIVEKIVAVHDVGRIINPLTASSQVQGGIL
jgi:CO/xanthine dehydrogenase Mo-binding subunit